MTITDAETIDIIATRPGSDRVKLIITDHLPWDDVHAHSLLLQTKVNTYVAFVETGQLQRVREPPIPDTPEILITLVAPEAPPVAAQDQVTRPTYRLTYVAADRALGLWRLRRHSIGKPCG
jgi:hypothetical protein